MTQRSRRGGGRATAAAVFTAAVIVSVASVVSAGAAVAIETDTFRLTPSPLEIQGFERRSFAFDPAPGGTVSDAIRVTNKTDQPRRFRVYGADAARDRSTGKVSVAAGSQTAVGIGTWLEFGTNELVLDGRSSEVVEFTLTRPGGASTEGIGAVVVEEVVDPAAAGGIDVLYRLALLVRLDGDVAGLRVGEPVMSAPVELLPSRSEVRVTLENETLQPVRPVVRVTAAGLTGRYWELAEEELRLSAGESTVVSVPWTTVPRWGGYFEPAVSVAWEGGSIVRTGPRSLHPPLWLLALAIVVVGVRAVRELRAPTGERAEPSDRELVNA